MAKKEKLVSAKKLPGLLKKKYTEKSLESKILKKIDIPTDRDLVKKLFKPDEKKPGFLSVDLKAQIEKNKLKKLKKIAKDVKSRKFGFKVIPFAALLIFIAALCAGVVLFKDVAAKKAIVTAMQSVFDAKTDLESVHLEILGAKLEGKNLCQASSDDEMKNIFEISDFTVDFNLTEALRGKIDIENISFGEVLFNTDRTKSGKLAKSSKAKMQKEKAAKKDKAAGTSHQSDLMGKTQNTLENMFSDYNPQNIYDAMQKNLKSPDLSLKIQNETQVLIEKWQDEPENIKKMAEDLKTITAEVNKIDWQNLKDPVKIKEVMELINSGIKTGNEISEKTQKIVKDVDTDSKAVSQYSKQINEAIASDRKLIDSEISKFTNLKDKGLKNVFNDMITAFVYGMAEQYSPNARKILDKGFELKAKHNSSAAKKDSDKKKAKKLKLKKRIAQRDSGRFVYYREDRVPKFLLEKAYGSGTGWSFKAEEFSSDADKRGTESLLDAAVSISGIDNKLNAVIDARSASENPLVNALYSGKHIPSDVVIDSYGMKSSSDLDCSILVQNEDDGVFGEGVLNLSDVQILTPSFEPAAVYEIYKDTLDSIKTMKINFGYKWTEDAGLNLDLKTNAAETFQNAFTASFNKASSKIADEAKSKITKMLSEQTGLAEDKIKEFADIEKLIKGSDKEVQGMKNELQKKKKELENQASGAVNAAKEQAKEKAKEEAGKQVKNMLKGFGL